MVDETPQIHWYAIKVFFNKVFEIEKILDADGVECYIPCKTVSVTVRNVSKQVRKTIIPSLMFFRSTEQYAGELQTRLLNRVIVYTNTDQKGKKHPATIPDQQMNMFILVTSADDNGLEYFAEDYMQYKEGEKVRVNGGIFKGAEGYVKRIKHNRRLTVTLTGVCMVATSFIPPCFLEKLD